MADILLKNCWYRFDEKGNQSLRLNCYDREDVKQVLVVPLS